LHRVEAGALAVALKVDRPVKGWKTSSENCSFCPKGILSFFCNLSAWHEGDDVAVE